MSLQGRSPNRSFCGRTRREFIWQTGMGFTGLGLLDLLSRESARGGSADQNQTPGEVPYVNPLAPKSPHYEPKAKAVIFLFMYGGPSHVDTFDYKPELFRLDGKTVAVKTKGRAGTRNEGRIVGPKWRFRRYGESGQWISDLFPHLARRADDLAFMKSMTADSPLHGSAMLQMNSGRILSGNPCLGSWVTYGLGSENENLPGFVVMLDPRGGPISGAKNWSSGFMPSTYQGTILRSKGEPIIDLQRPEGMSESAQRRLLDTLNTYNNEHYAERADNSDLAARISSFELAYKMQMAAPEATDISSETEETQRLYGLDDAKTENFGRRCLLARRLVERGVRFVQIYAGGAHNDDNWDAHTDIVKNHEYHAGRTDRPIAGLLEDLKRRGLLDSTLIVWGGEFGRQPTAEYEKGTGRDHNSYGFTMWMAGGGVKGGSSVGETDELGGSAVTNRFHVKNLHATILHLLGLDPEGLTYYHGGLDQKLVGVEGAEIIREII